MVDLPPDLQLALREDTNEWLREMRTRHLTDRAAQLEYEHGLDELEKRLSHEATLRELARLEEFGRAARRVLRALPPGDAFQREQKEYGEAIRGLDDIRRRVAALFEPLARRHPRAVEVDVSDSPVRSRSPLPRPSRSLRALAGGAKLEFRVFSPIPGHLAVFNHGTSGYLHLVFPNRWHPDGRIQADEVVEIPDSSLYSLGRLPGTPFGVEVVRAIVTARPVHGPLARILAGRDFVTWAPVESVRMVTAMARRLMTASPAAWGLGELAFELRASSGSESAR